MGSICSECGHAKEHHMINGSKTAVCQVGGLTEDPCQCQVMGFVPTRVWNALTRTYDHRGGDNSARN